MKLKYLILIWVLSACAHVLHANSNAGKNIDHSLFHVKHYWSIKPINLIGFNPNLQFGTCIKANDSLKRRYMNFSLSYPYGPPFIQTTYLHFSYPLTFSNKGFQFEHSYRILNKKNRFWGPVMELQYQDLVYSVEHSSTGYVVYRDRYWFLRAGIQFGKYYKKKNSKVIHALYYGIAIRWAYDYYYPLNKGFGHYYDASLGGKIYLNWQFGRATK